MKDSGVPWIGSIPQNWETGPIKSAVAWKSVKGHGQATVLSLYRDYGVVPKDSRDDNHNVTSTETDAYKFVEKGDLVINKMKAWQGSMAISQFEGIVSPAYHVASLTNENVYAPYFNYLIRDVSYLPEYTRLSTGMRIGQWDLAFDDFIRIPFLLPPLEEQRRIADYLDAKAQEVDAAIEKTRESIEEYQKLKKAVITQAVTKGIRPNRSMKDSGVEWIDAIPGEWEIMKVLRTLAMPVTDGPHETPELQEEGIPFISAEAVSAGNGKIDFSHKWGNISQEYYEECCKKYKPELNDIYMIKSGATTGRVAIVETNELFTIWSPLAVFRSNPQKVHPKFLFYALQSETFFKQVELGWTFGTQQNIGMRTLEKLKVCLPSIHEQQEIAVFLDEKCGAIDALLEKKQQIITELESYKKSLIYEYVTGKKEVPA